MKVEVLSLKYDCICGSCGRAISLNVYLSFYQGQAQNITGKAYEPHYYIGQCPHCGMPVMVDIFNKKVIPPAKEFENVTNLESVPDVQALYEECRSAYSVGAYSCCLLATRKLLMHIAVSFGAEPGKSFVQYVDYLDSNHYTPAKSKNWVDKIRKLGNEATHEIVISSKEQAYTAISFVAAILRFAYQYSDVT